jgi:hypothetical protein
MATCFHILYIWHCTDWGTDRTDYGALPTVWSMNTVEIWVLFVYLDLLGASEDDLCCYCLRAKYEKRLSGLVVCALCRVSHSVENPWLVITNHTVIYQWKWNLVTAYLGGCGGNVVAEIGFSVPRDTANTTLHFSKCCSLSCTNWAGRHWVIVAKYTTLPSYVFIGKLFCDL